MNNDCNKCSPIEVGPSPEHILASYGLCTAYNEFIENKCIWTVDLQDGSKVFQDDDRPGCAVASAWKRLGHYVQKHPENPIVKMRLRFGTHIIALPERQPMYFYSRGLIQAVTQSFGLDFHIVGWPDKDGNLMCVWYKVPELVITETSSRKISECQPEQIISGITT
jgi:hypothetical protein